MLFRAAIHVDGGADLIFTRGIVTVALDEAIVHSSTQNLTHPSLTCRHLTRRSRTRRRLAHQVSRVKASHDCDEVACCFSQNSPTSEGWGLQAWEQARNAVTPANRYARTPHTYL